MLCYLLFQKSGTKAMLFHYYSKRDVHKSSYYPPNHFLLSYCFCSHKGLLFVSLLTSTENHPRLSGCKQLFMTEICPFHSTRMVPIITIHTYYIRKSRISKGKGRNFTPFQMISDISNFLNGKCVM